MWKKASWTLIQAGGGTVGLRAGLDSTQSQEANSAEIAAASTLPGHRSP